MARTISSLDKVTVGISRDINSQYDKVKTVAENIESIQTIADNLVDILALIASVEALTLQIADLDTRLSALE